MRAKFFWLQFKNVGDAGYGGGRPCSLLVLLTCEEKQQKGILCSSAIKLSSSVRTNIRRQTKPPGPTERNTNKPLKKNYTKSQNTCQPTAHRCKSSSMCRGRTQRSKTTKWHFKISSYHSRWVSVPLSAVGSLHGDAYIFTIYTCGDIEATNHSRAVTMVFSITSVLTSVLEHQGWQITTTTNLNSVEHIKTQIDR